MYLEIRKNQLHYFALNEAVIRLYMGINTTGNVPYNLILRRFSATIVAVEKQ